MLQKTVCIHHVFIYHMRCANNVVRYVLYLTFLFVPRAGHTLRRRERSDAHLESEGAHHKF
jgi:hypothetical protein